MKNNVQIFKIAKILNIINWNKNWREKIWTPFKITWLKNLAQ